MTAFRKVFFWTHLAAGLAAALLIAVMCFTGVLMAYQSQIEKFMDHRGVSSHPPFPGAQPLSIDRVVAGVRAAKGIDPEYATVSPDSTAPVEVYLDRETGTVYADAYTGGIIGQPSSATYNFFREVRGWHRWLGVNGSNRGKFRAVIDAANFVFLFLTVFGLYLWMPRRWTWRHLRAVALLRTDMKGRAREFNWHNVIGLWSAVPILIMVWTGMAMSYPWAKRLTYRAAGTPLQTRAETGSASADQAEDDDAPPSPERFSGLDALLALAKRQTPGWKAITLMMPDDTAESVEFLIDMGGGNAGPAKPADLELDRTGNVVSFGAAGPEPVTARSFIRIGHTGELWGVAGQTIAGVSCLGGLFLVWTGASLSMRRFNSWRTRRLRRAPGRVEIAAKHPKNLPVAARSRIDCPAES
ncbi:MAG: PepSY-associated helix protein [Bryobacterales bacterium]|nr:PepSY-associated helix protein [Bryobacterales bacterium]